MKDISVQLESKYNQIQTLKIKLTQANSWRRPRFVLGRAGRLTGRLVHCWSPPLFFSFAGLCLFSFLFFQTLFSLIKLYPLLVYCRNHYSTVFDCDWKTSREFLLCAVRGVQTLCFIGRRHDPVERRFDEVR